MLGAILEQVVIELERVPEEISRVLQKQKKAVSGLKPRLDDIVKMLQLITSLHRTFMVIGALDECTAVQQYRFLYSVQCSQRARPQPRPRQATPKNSLGRSRPNSIGLQKPIRPDRRLGPDISAGDRSPQGYSNPLPSFEFSAFDFLPLYLRPLLLNYSNHITSDTQPTQ